jgi:ABC-type glycerol-3-phosphate transport system substrate-binding protein
MSQQAYSRRQFLTGLTLAAGGAAIAGLTGCTPKAPPTAVPAKEAPAQPAKVPEAPKAAPQKVVVRVQIQSGSLGPQLHDMADKWNAEHADKFEIVGEDVPYGDISMKTQLGYAVGDLQDVLHAFTRWYFTGAFSGWYLPLGDLIDQTGLIPDYEDFYKIAIDNSLWEGKIYGVPEAPYVAPNNVIMWNRGLFEEAGVPVPNPDMDVWDLFETAKAVTDVDAGIFGFQANQGTQGRLNTIVRNWGKPEYGANGDISTWLTPDGKKVNFLENVGCIEWFSKWYQPLLAERVIPTAEDAVQGGLFEAGRVAIDQGHQGFPRRRELSVGDNWDFHPEDAILFPKGPEGRVGTSQEGHYKCIYSGTKVPNEALEFIGFITSVEGGKIGFDRTGSYSARKSVWTDPANTSKYPIFLAMDELMESGRVEPYPLPDNLRDQEFTDIFQNVMNPIWQGTASWAEHAPGVQQQLQAHFDLPRP